MVVQVPRLSRRGSKQNLRSGRLWARRLRRPRPSCRRSAAGLSAEYRSAGARESRRWPCFAGGGPVRHPGPGGLRVSRGLERHDGTLAAVQRKMVHPHRSSRRDLIGGTAAPRSSYAGPGVGGTQDVRAPAAGRAFTSWEAPGRAPAEGGSRTALGARAQNRRRTCGGCHAARDGQDVFRSIGRARSMEGRKRFLSPAHSATGQSRAP